MTTTEVTASELCEWCVKGDHSVHRRDLGDICVGCPCPGGPDARELLAGFRHRAEGVTVITDRYVSQAEGQRLIDQDVPRLLAALAAVLDIHAEDDAGQCGVCTDEDDNPQYWPCETVWRTAYELGDQR